MTTKPTTLQALEEEADSYGELKDGVIRYYFKNGEEIGYAIVDYGPLRNQATDIRGREWGEKFKARLNMTRINIGRN